MNFERNKESYRSLRIGSGRSLKILWVSMGAGARMSDDKVEGMLKYWISTNSIPSGVYPLVRREDGTEQFVETIDLIGELIEWGGGFYQIPPRTRIS